jgi:hypothetical protein
MWEWNIAPPFLTLELDRDESSVLRRGRFIPGGRAPGTHYIGSWMILSGRRGEEKNLALPGIYP